MQATIGTIGIGILSFITTNIDDFLLLLFLFSAQSSCFRSIIGGQFLGIALLIAISCFISFLGSQLIPTQNIGLLGIIPILLGVRELVRRRSNLEAHYEINKNNIFISTTLLTLASGGDNIAVYVPLFLEHTVQQISIFATTFLAMTGAWCFLSFRLASSNVISKNVNSLGKKLYPFGLILIGIYIIINRYSPS